MRRRPLVMIERVLEMDKTAWREAEAKRSFEDVDAGPLLLEAAREGRVHWIEEKRPLQLGVFDLRLEGEDRVRVMLVGEACLRLLGTPERRTRQIGLLRPWRALQVRINGRAAYTSGQVYTMREYYLMLVDEEVPVRVGEIRYLDFEADLM